jgi:hypothetical protein
MKIISLFEISKSPGGIKRLLFELNSSKEFGLTSDYSKIIKITDGVWRETSEGSHEKDTESYGVFFENGHILQLPKSKFAAEWIEEG